MQRVKVGKLEGRVHLKINQAVKLLEGVVNGKDWRLMDASVKKLEIKSVLDEAIQRLDVAAQKLITEAPRFRDPDDLDYGAFASNDRESEAGVAVDEGS